METSGVEADREECPACGGAGGGPFGRAGSVWDVETYECVRCGGWGYLIHGMPVDAARRVVAKPGIVKAAPPAPAVEEKKRRTGA